MPSRSASQSLPAGATARLVSLADAVSINKPFHALPCLRDFVPQAEPASSLGYVAFLVSGYNPYVSSFPLIVMQVDRISCVE
jgi:hypothetical protein